MSADDMLAAQLWPWPDPIIKRNAYGGVAFVNAAFLQVYGGQVADWHGCAVEGWPTPMVGNMPNRFETRMRSASGEMVYDWLEYVMPDGGALAISRNITVLVNQTPPPGPNHTAVPHIDANSAEAHTQAPHSAPPTNTDMPVAAHPPVDAQPLDAQPLDAQPLDTQPLDTQPLDALPLDALPLDALPLDTQPLDTQPLDTQPALDIAPNIGLNADPEPLQDPAPMVDTLSEQHAEIEPIVEAEPITAAPFTAARDERDFERRALPIENGENILGSNWRDAVIAKAVGGTESDAAQTAEVEKDTAIEDSPIAAPQSSLLAGANDQDGALKILLAEDNAINALLTRTLLEADGYHVEVVEDGSLAVDAVRVNKYDMILMDMRMPNMDGLEATRKIRSLSNEGKSIPIIALTANAFDDDRNACFDAGMNDFMTKPVSAEELQQMVQTWTRIKSAAA